MDQFREGLGDAWTSIATFVPKLVGFLLILVIGYFVAKLITKLLERVLERVGFDRLVERGGIKSALANSKLDASSILTKVLFYILFLFVLQLAFSVFPANPISDLIHDLIAYLPKIFVAIVIVVIGAAIAAAAKEVIEAMLAGLDYGSTLAKIASVFILGLTAFAAADQLGIAETITGSLFNAIVATIGATIVVAVGGGGIQTMSKYWDRAAQRMEQESGKIKEEAQGATERIKDRAQERKEQLQGGGSSGSGSSSPPSGTVVKPAGGTTSEMPGGTVPPGGGTPTV